MILFLENLLNLNQPKINFLNIFMLLSSSLFLRMNYFISYQLGEVEVSNLTIIICAIFSSFTFLAVGISSYKLYKSLISDDDSN